MPYRFFLPTPVECGAGISAKIGEMLSSRGAGRVFVVTDKGVVKAGLLEPIQASLRASRIEFGVFDETEQNPSAESIARGLQSLRDFKADHVLALGGGSSIDTAKGISIMAANDGEILDYEGVGLVPNAGLPLTAIPTTAGTGSEVTASTIITNSISHFKTAILSPYLFPKLALLDPLLTYSLPPGITAATGMDALTHAIESYTSRMANPISKSLALQAVRMIGASLFKAYSNGTDAEAREQMLVASMMVGAAFAQTRLGNVHAISHTLGGVFNIAHGIANAALLPFVMRFNLPACAEGMAEIAAALGQDTGGSSPDEAAELAIEAVTGMNRQLQIPSNIQDLGVSLELLPKLVEDAMRSGNVLANPRATNAGDIRRIIENAYHGNPGW